MSFKAISLVLVGVVFGCSAGQAVRAVAQVPAAPAGTTPAERYQYTCKSKENPRIFEEDTQAMLNAMGAQGWRLIPNRYATTAPQASYADIYCFERRF
jgi:hypothetical protein